jgi:hypothetical protein
MDNPVVALVQTVHGILFGFTEHEVKDACDAHEA